MIENLPVRPATCHWIRVRALWALKTISTLRSPGTGTFWRCLRFTACRS